MLAGALLTLTLLIGGLINLWGKVDSHKGKVSDSIFPFISLNLIPIAAVAVATWYGHYFGWGLLQFTQYALKRVVSAF